MRANDNEWQRDVHVVLARTEYLYSELMSIWYSITVHTRFLVALPSNINRFLDLIIMSQNQR
jgi:hypothetical protein